MHKPTHTPRTLGPLASVTAICAWVGVIILLLQLFRTFDWGYGLLRGGLLIGLLAWTTWPLWLCGSVRLRVPTDRRWAWLAPQF